MKLGVFSMIPQLKAKVLNGSHQHHQKAKKFVFESQKWNACVFLRQQGNYSPPVCPWGANCHWKFLSVLERLWKRIGYVQPEYSAPGSWFLLHDNAPVHRAVAVQEFLAQKQECLLHNPHYSRFIPLWLFSVPQNEVTIERVPVWRCSRHPSSCDIESSGHTTRRRAEVLPVFARSCHSLYRYRRDVLWIKYR